MLGKTRLDKEWIPRQLKIVKFTHLFEGKFYLYVFEKKV